MTKTAIEKAFLPVFGIVISLLYGKVDEPEENFAF